MLRSIRVLFCLPLAMTLWQTTASAQGPMPAINLVPSDAVVCIEITRPRELLDLMTSERMTETLASLPFYQKLTTTTGFNDFFSVIESLETSLGMEWREALKKLTGGGIILAVRPNDTVLLIVDAEDESLLRRTHELLIDMVRSDAESKGLPDPVESAEFMGVTGWSFNGEEAHAIIGKRLIFSNHAWGLTRVLALRAGNQGTSLASSVHYQKAQEAGAADPAARVFVTHGSGLIKGIRALGKSFDQDQANPLTALFLSGIVEPLRNSNWLWLGLDVEENGLTLRACMDGKAASQASAASFARPSGPDQGVMPNLWVPRRTAAFSFYRDLHSFYSAKDELFPERTSALIFFENMMGIFFSGRDLTDEVFIEAKPELRFVIAEQDYDPASGIPQVQVPAFAAILRLRDAEEFDEVIEEAWQKAIGLINFTQGQQAKPGLIIDRPIHNGTKFTMTYFSKAGLDESAYLDTRFNFRPALAMPEDYLILSSTDDLARDLIDALREEAKGPRKPLPGIHSMAELDGEQLASILRANYDSLVRQNMVDEGSTQEEAETAIDLLATLASLVKNANLSIRTHDEFTEARLSLELNLE